jgi:L-arabinose isomerase
MLANTLRRSGRPGPCVTAALDDEVALHSVIRTVRAAAAAGSCRGATLMAIGGVMDGLDDVAVTAKELARLGLRAVEVTRSGWQSEVDEATGITVPDALDELGISGWTGEVGANADIGARLTTALGHALDDSGAIAGAVNCHGPYFRTNRAIGVAACFGVAYHSTLGRPLSCTGDLPTALALYLAKRVSGAALYCEPLTADTESGLLMIGAGPEGDLAWAADAAGIAVVPTPMPGQRGYGDGVAMSLRYGPATLVSLSPGAERWTLAWATGRIVEGPPRPLEGTSGWFRFDTGMSGDVSPAWIGSGATHHCALALGDLSIEMPVIAEALGARSVRV